MAEEHEITVRRGDRRSSVAVSLRSDLPRLPNLLVLYVALTLAACTRQAKAGPGQDQGRTRQVPTHYGDEEVLRGGRLDIVSCSTRNDISVAPGRTWNACAYAPSPTEAAIDATHEHGMLIGEFYS